MPGWSAGLCLSPGYGLDKRWLLFNLQDPGDRFCCMLKPITNGGLRSRLTEQLFDAILRGDLAPGARIVEGKLARQLSVSQSTLREALQELTPRAF